MTTSEIEKNIISLIDMMSNSNIKIKQEIEMQIETAIMDLYHLSANEKQYILSTQ